MKRWIIIGAALSALLCVIGAQGYAIHKIKQERNRNARNVATLLADVEQYQTRDSLNAAKVGALELTIQEYKRFRAEDAATIKSLNVRNRDLRAVTNTQMETIMRLQAAPKDTIVIRDSVSVPAVSVHSGDAWYDFHGLLTPDAFTGTLAVRDSLLLVETVKYKRCLFFKTKKIKNRQLDVVSKCPYTTITGIEHVVIEK